MPVATSHVFISGDDWVPFRRKQAFIPINDIRVSREGDDASLLRVPQRNILTKNSQQFPSFRITKVRHPDLSRVGGEVNIRFRPVEGHHLV